MVEKPDFKTAITCVEGTLGKGKTLTLTYLLFRKYLAKNTIFTNYHLDFPKFKSNSQPEIIFIDKLEDLLKMKHGYAGLDELWAYIDCRKSNTKMNKIVTGILLASRKRDINISYTAQSFFQVDKRLREVTDYLAVPTLYSNNKICRIAIYEIDAKTNYKHLIRTYKFKTEPIFKFFDTTEEVKVFGNEETKDESEPVEDKKELTEQTFGNENIEDVELVETENDSEPEQD